MLVIITAIVFGVVAHSGSPAAVVLGTRRRRRTWRRCDIRWDSISHCRRLCHVAHMCAGDLGKPILSRQPVLTLIWRALPITLYLSLRCSSPCHAIPQGRLRSEAKLLAGRSLHDPGLLGVSTPGFWLAIKAGLCLRVVLGWVPLLGYISLREDPSESPKAW